MVTCNRIDSVLLTGLIAAPREIAAAQGTLKSMMSELKKEFQQEATCDL